MVMRITALYTQLGDTSFFSGSSNNLPLNFSIEGLKINKMGPTRSKDCKNEPAHQPFHKVAVSAADKL